jgi:hypothetical protein
MVTIGNFKGNNLSRNGQKLELRNQSTINESWKFVLVEKGNHTSSTGLNMVNSNAVNSSSTSQSTFIPPNGTIVALQNRNGGFIGGIKGNNEKVIIANANQAWEKFIVEWRPNNKIALKQQVSNLYLGQTQNTEERLALVQTCDNNEVFQIEPKENGFVGIKNQKGNYIRKRDKEIVWQNHCKE